MQSAGGRIVFASGNIRLDPILDEQRSGYGFQIDAMQERKMAYVFGTSFYSQGTDSGAAEGIGRNLSYVRRNRDIGQGGATVEGFFANGSNSLGDRYGREIYAAEESAIIDFLYTVGNRNDTQGRAAIKHFLGDTSQILGQTDPIEIGAARKCVLSDIGHTIG